MVGSQRPSVEWRVWRWWVLKAEAAGGGAGRDVLSPLDLERIFGLHRGNIFHGALSLHQVSQRQEGRDSDGSWPPLPHYHGCLHASLLHLAAYACTPAATRTLPSLSCEARASSRPQLTVPCP